MAAQEPATPVSAGDGTTLWSLTREAWTIAPRLLRKLALVLWGVGLAAMAVSITADVMGWWGNLSFTENLVSEVISSLIALPIALLVINRLSAYQLEVSLRPRLEARMLVARQRTLQAVVGLRRTLSVIRDDVKANTERLVDGTQLVRGDLADAVAAAEAAANLARLTDTSEWHILEAAIAPVRIGSQHLEVALTEFNNSTDITEDIDEFNEHSSALQSSLSQLRRTMDRDHALFAESRVVTVEETTTRKLRNAAINYMKNLLHLIDLCDAVEALLVEVTEPHRDVMR